MRELIFAWCSCWVFISLVGMAMTPEIHWGQVLMASFFASIAGILYGYFRGD